MTSKYNDIFNRFMDEVRDYEFAHLDEPDITKQMRNWLHKSLSKPRIKRIFATFSRDDELAEIEYTLKLSVDEDTDKNFVEELLEKQMIVEWLSPKVNTTTLINQMITNSKEQKWYNQKDHLHEMRDLKDNAYIEVCSMLRDKGYIWNEYLGNTNNGKS